MGYSVPAAPNATKNGYQIARTSLPLRTAGHEPTFTRKTGLVYRVQLSDHSANAIKLAPLADMGFKDGTGAAAGCYPNQLQGIALSSHFAYVVSVCASPRGPTGPKVTTTACATAG